MNYLTLGIIGFTVGLSGAMLPGPMLIYTISKVMQGSVISGIKIVFGHMLVEVVAITLILLGLKEIIGSRIISTLLSLIGGLTLIMIGLYIIFKATHTRLPKESSEKNIFDANFRESNANYREFINGTISEHSRLISGNSRFRRVLQRSSSGLIAGGIFFTAFNPTFPTWWVTIGASLLSKALLSGIIGVVILTIGHWLADLVWFGSVSFAVCKGRSLLDDRIHQVVLRILGVALLGLGIYFISQG